MELRVLENGKKKFIFELEGTDHTICNALKEELWEDKNVLVAAYSIEHPLIGIPRITVEMSSGDPQKAILDAISRLKKKNSTFLSAFKKLK
ncbi:hypothetical protein CMO92_04790 [Candidatus Woesearchaeota archaeon]|nr:hypothetical protein [Candidatus Woesearchaeota archaeon]|tara:strand:- start:598 stop:870 length:273 start_codon:yes stop_codon:yes gene_type:complete